MDLSQYAELFLAESREHLGTLNQLLLDWERHPTATEPLAGIFRSVHTIKGMAATMGYRRVADLAHRTENLLDLLRRGERGVNREAIDLLFRAADALEAAIEAAVQGRERAADDEPLLRELDAAAAAVEGEARGSAGSRPSAPIVTPATGEGRTVRVTLRLEAALKGARAVLVLKRMEELGAVHSIEPAPIAIESDEFDGRFSFRIDAPVPDDVLAAAVRGVGDVEDVWVGQAEAPVHRGDAPQAGGRHIRVDLRRLDTLMNLIGEMATVRGTLAALAAARSDPELDDVAIKVQHLSSSLQDQIIQARMTPVWQVFDRFPRLVRDLARQLDKQVAFRVEGKEIELDRAILDEIGDPLLHLIRNAVDHGIESPAERRAAGKAPEGRIVLSAARERNAVAIRIADDGRGIDRPRILERARAMGMVDAAVQYLTDEMLLRVLAHPGFSTAGQVSDVSGRGVGVDVVIARLRAVGGTVHLTTELGKGTTFTLRLPPTLAIVNAVLTRVGAERFALPITHVTETLALEQAAVTEVDGRTAITLRDQVVPLVHLRELLGTGGTAQTGQPVIILQIGERRSGLVVDQVLGQQEVVVKGFARPPGTLPIFSGATILGDGRPVLILDAGGLV